ncbi:MAG TPA: hypothetical protein VKP30_33545 [Polyangiaceae bacterium]|nr:hypothetical protein [Polyangiaceae bacterium]
MASSSSIVLFPPTAGSAMAAIATPSMGGTAAGVPAPSTRGSSAALGSTELGASQGGAMSRSSMTNAQYTTAGGLSSTSEAQSNTGGTQRDSGALSGSGGASDSRETGQTSVPRPSTTPSTASGGTACTSGRFQSPQPINELLPDGYDYFGPSLSADGLSLYFAASRSEEEEDDLYVSTRTTRTAEFPTAIALEPINTARSDGSPSISRDGLTLYFYSMRAGGSGGRDLYAATRKSLDAPFRRVQSLDQLNGPADDYLPSISGDGLTLIYSSTRSGGSDLFVATRPDASSDFSRPSALEGLNTEHREDRAAFSSDGQTIYFISDRPNGVGDKDIWVATRNSRRGGFSTPKVLELVNSETRDIDVSLSADDRELYFVSKRSGQFRLYRSLWDCPNGTTQNSSRVQ